MKLSLGFVTMNETEKAIRGRSKMLEDSNVLVRKIERIHPFEVRYDIDDVDGSGRMDCLTVYSGIQVIYNRFDCFKTPSNSKGNKGHIEINHCLRGKYEGLYHKSYYAYLSPGDLSVSKWSLERVYDSFPLGYYEGVEILIDLEKARGNPILSHFHIDVHELEQKLMLSDNLVVLKSTQQIQHIFLEMYEIEEKIKLDYLKIKVLELLLFLLNTDFKMLRPSNHYYPRKQIEIVKEIKKYLSEHRSQHHDFQKLADAYHINIHTLRKTFKDIYGISIYRWFKEYRLEYSSRLLLETDWSTLEIANQIGYSNPSKYAAAFAKYFQMTPKQYRKFHMRMDSFE